MNTHQDQSAPVILWRRVDRPGHESARVNRVGEGWQLAVGERAEVRAAWLRFPGLALEPLRQTYIRTGEHAYRYESAGGAFVRDLQVDEAGFPVRYPGFWEREGG